ncbi:MAG: lysylphosphatidylglycerol synthase transmembrane domain-containing protein [Haloarculaceae archaeon]
MTVQWDTLGFADRETVVRTAVGFVVAVLVLYLVATGLGTERVAGALAGADPRWLAAGCLSTLLCLALWGRAWQVVLRQVGIDVPYRRLVVTYFAATFANYVTPLGQAGGEPFIAYVLARDTDAPYEESLASVVTADLLNLLPFFTFAAAGLSVLLLGAELPTAVRPLAFGLLGMAVGVPAIAAGGWWFREWVKRGVVRLVAPVARRTDRVSVEGVRRRVEDLYTAFGRIATNPRALLEAALFAYAGWVFFALPLFFAGRALGAPVDLLLVLFVVPASTLAGLVPSPGGLGGVEVALVALLAGLTPVGAATAFALALVYRVASYWFALVVGGAAALLVVRRA